MAKEFIKDFYGRVLGTVETIGTKQVVKDFYGKVVATYDTKDNFTRDFYGRVVSKGNTAVGMLFSAKR